jgi:acyl-CoA dehydrogenase
VAAHETPAMLAALRQRFVSGPLFARARKRLPALSQTEREALAAGDIWWDGDLFSGNPDWNRLLQFEPACLTDIELAFLAGPVDELCSMLDDWRINVETLDLPPEVWAFLKRNKFFGMIIPRDYGGLGFSAFAHSEVVKRIATRSITAAITVMVPNSLGPGELLLEFGTDEQRGFYLPRLADGLEIPCFALTSAQAGSDAAAMEDHGVVCRAMHEGRQVLGMRLSWSKRYITLAPVATLLGLAFKLHDPEGLLGDREDLGITLALIPTTTPGVQIGRRHLAGLQAFQNGPTSGTDVFIPLDRVIGGRSGIGAGWRMLMSALSAGRGISLPSLATASACLTARSTGAYARIREQFGLAIGRFEGVQERLGRMAGIAYELEAARRLTCAGLDQGHSPAIVSAIVKSHATYRMRTTVDDAMDIHGGKAIVDGPLNYLGNLYRAVPIGITVEGANILTRSLIIFGQGALRAHPYLLQEMQALQDPDSAATRARFDRAFVGHAGHFMRVFGRCWLRSWSAATLAPAPSVGGTRGAFRLLSRYAAALAFASEVSLLALGASLKRRESISARLGDVLSELYLLSAVLKRYHDEGQLKEDAPLAQWCCEAGYARIETALEGVIANFPVRPLAWILRAVILPMGVRHHGPGDATTQTCAELLMQPGPSRDRLTPGVYPGRGNDSIARLERAFTLVHEVAPLKRKLRDAGHGDDRIAAAAVGMITESESARLAEADAAVLAAIVVDSFTPDELLALAPVRRFDERKPDDGGEQRHCARSVPLGEHAHH